MPIFFNGSYSDEYYHITSGLEFVKSGHFAEIYSGSVYDREGYFSIIVGITLKMFGEKIFVAKLIPALIGVINLILLIYVASKIFKKKHQIVFLVMGYTSLPWTILNHFYVRFYVFLELIILFIVSLFLYDKTHYKIRGRIIIILINIVFLIFYRGASSNLINAFSIVLLLSDFLTTNKLILLKKIKECTSFIKKNYSPLIMLILPVIFAILLAGNFVVSNLRELLFGTLKYANNDTNYYVFFFSLNFIPTAMVFFSSVFILMSKGEKELLVKPILLSFLTLFSLHLISNPASHTIRAIFYLMPLYLLFTFYVLALINKKVAAFLIILIGLTIYGNYPTNFFKYPYINGEIMYYGNEVYSVIKKECANSIIITANRPDILLFYGIKSDFYLNTEYSNSDWVNNDPESKYSFLDSSTNSFYYTYTKTPVLKSEKDLEGLIDQHQNFCLITGLMPFSWIDENTRNFIQSKFTLKFKDLSSTEKNAPSLYVFNSK
jgi:hypothetical protein